MLTFEDIKDIVQKKEFKRLHRTPEVQAAYEAKKAEILKTQSLEEYILKNKFPNMELCDYPYDLEPGLNHWILWTFQKRFDLTKFYNKLNSLKEEKGIEYVVWENPESIKSVHVKHYHVVIKK